MDLELFSRSAPQNALLLLSPFLFVASRLPLSLCLLLQAFQPCFLVFTKDAHEEGIEVRVQDHDVWLTQKAIGQFFDVDRSVVTKHKIIINLLPILFRNQYNRLSLRDLFLYRLTTGTTQQMR